MTTVEIKAFTSSDLDFVTGLARDEEFAPGIGEIEIYAQTDSQGIWVAWQGSERVGCIAGVTYNPDYAFIGLFVVHPDHRGKGIGRQLWNHALAALEGVTVTCIGLEAAPAMVDVYKRSGFKKDSITKHQQRLCLSEESQRPGSTILHRTSSHLFATFPWTPFRITTPATRSAPDHIFSNAGFITVREKCLSPWTPAINVMATCESVPACCPLVKAGASAHSWQKTQASHPSC